MKVDVFLSGCTVEVPDGTDLNSNEGHALVKDLARARFLSMLQHEDFDVDMDEFAETLPPGLASLRVEKSYHHRRHDGRQTIKGLIRLPEGDVEAFRQAMARRAISSVDPRIVWEEEVDTSDGWEYEDWSFQIIGEDEA